MDAMPSDAPFPILQWRQAVAALAARIGTEAIAPFGFELTGSTGYLRSPLRYLFVYLARRPGLPEGSAMIREVCEALGDSLPAVASTIEIIDVDRHAGRTGAACGTRTLVVRSVDTAASMIDTWVRYVVSTALSSNRPLLTAVSDFDSDIMAQRYCCQLAMIHSALFETLPRGPVLADADLLRSHLRDLQRVSLRERYSMDLIESGVAQRIAEILRGYYQSLNGFLAPHLQGAIQGLPDFHGTARLELPHSPLLDAVVRLALDRFNCYPGVAPVIAFPAEHQ
jgi:hypothetical protein